MVKSTRHIITTINDLDLTKQIERFVLVSSSNVTRPLSFTSILANIMHSYILAHKYSSEKVLRESGLKYLIIRPTALHYGENPTEFTLDQGDKIKGMVTPATVAHVAVDTLLDHWIYPNTTFECSSQSHQLSQKYNYLSSQYAYLKPDDVEKEKKREINHKLPARLFKGFLMILASALVYGTMQFIKAAKMNKAKVFLK